MIYYVKSKKEWILEENNIILAEIKLFYFCEDIVKYHVRSVTDLAIIIAHFYKLLKRVPTVCFSNKLLK